VPNSRQLDVTSNTRERGVCWLPLRADRSELRSRWSAHAARVRGGERGSYVSMKDGAWLE
jgi:hypothetical protein